MKALYNVIGEENGKLIKQEKSDSKFDKTVTSVSLTTLFI